MNKYYIKTNSHYFIAYNKVEKEFWTQQGGFKNFCNNCRPEPKIRYLKSTTLLLKEVNTIATLIGLKFFKLIKHT